MKEIKVEVGDIRKAPIAEGLFHMRKPKMDKAGLEAVVNGIKGALSVLGLLDTVTVNYDKKTDLITVTKKGE